MHSKSAQAISYMFIFAVFISCATPAVIVQPPVASTPEEQRQLQRPPLIEIAVNLVRQNPPWLNNYFYLDENREIVVKSEPFMLTGFGGENGAFEAIYHMEHFLSLDFDSFMGGFFIPFTVISIDTEDSPPGDTQQDVMFWRPERDASGILLGLDNDHFENWESYFDFFDQYNARVTFFIQGEYNSFGNRALERRHDVGYHSLNHLDLRRLSRRDFAEETVSRVQEFRDAGVPLTAFAYPFGFSEPWMQEELLNTYRITRAYGVTIRIYNSETIREGFISSTAIDNTVIRNDDDFYRLINTMLRTVKFIGGDLVLSLASHVISDAAWGIRPDRLEYLFQLANDLQLNFYLYCDFFDSGAGNENSDS